MIAASLRRLAASLPARLALASSALFLLVAGGIQVEVVSVFQAHLKTAMAGQQFSFVGQIASQLDQDIAEAQRLLVSDANTIDPGLLAAPDRAQAFLDGRRALQTVFDYGLFLFGPDGRLVAESKAIGQDRRGLDFSALPYFTETVATRSPRISAPYLSASGSYRPVVMFTAPILDAGGVLKGVFSGGIDLTADNILARPSGIRIGERGTLAVYTAQGTVVTHTMREKILASFSSKSLEDAQAGVEGTQETTDWRGVPVLMTVRNLRAAPWTVAASYPTDELYAPLARARQLSFLIVAAGCAVAVLLTHLLTRYLTHGLRRLTDEVRHIDPDLGAVREVRTGGEDEVGRLAEALNRTLAAVRRGREQLQSLATELSIAEERERRRIATDLHDSICQTLAFANLHLGQIRAAAKDPAAAEGVEKVRRIIEQAVKEMHDLIFDLSPPIVYELGLTAALEWTADQFAERHGLAVTVEDDGAGKPLAQELQIFLFRAVRELLVNAVKHAKVGEAVVEVRRDGAVIRIAVLDRGAGFDPARLAAAPERGHGFGLLSIRERLRYFGGDFRVESAPGRGTRIELTAPCSG